LSGLTVRSLCPLTSKEGIEIERFRGTTSFARVEGFLQFADDVTV